MTKALNICLISPHYPPDFGWYGSGREALELAQELTKRGHKVSVVACAENTSSNLTFQDGNMVLRVDWKKFPRKDSSLAHNLPRARVLMNLNMSIWKGFLKLSQTSKFDVVDVFSNSAEDLIPSFLGEAPVVLHCGKTADFLETELRLLGDSGFQLESTVKDVLKSIAAQAANDSAFNYSVDTDYFKPDAGKAVDTKGRPTAIAYTSINNEKSQKLLVEIFSHVRQAVPNLFLIIIAHDIYSESSEGELKKVLSAAGVECDMVINRNMSKLILPQLWNNAHGSVLIDWGEFAPQALLEALSCGRAVIADFDGIDAGFLKDHSVLVKPESFSGEAIAQKLIEILKNSEFSKLIGEKSRQYVLEHHCRKAMADRRLRVYEEAIQSFASDDRRQKKIALMEKVLDCCASISDGFDGMLYDFLFLNSVRFKVKHWLRKLKGESRAQPPRTVSK